MKLLVYSGIGIATLWLQLTVIPLLEIWGTKPNLALATVLVMGIYWMEPWLFFYATLLGLAMDVFSHGILGIYGISFFCVSFLARMTGVSIYENSFLFGLSGVFGLSLVEGFISVTLLQFLDGSVPWWRWILTQVFPNALYNGLLAPVLFLLCMALSRKVKILEA